MPSSTSSSSPTRWRDVWHFGFGVWATAAIVVAAALFAPEGARSADIVMHQDPPSWGEFYLAHDRGGHVDHHVLYHGIDETAVARMREADVLFLGNSRLMFALEPAAMREYFGRLDLAYYVLGFGHEEQDDFPLRIIRDHDLRPAVVVVNADQFFAAEQSEWAAQVIDESDFDAWKVQFEAEMAHRVRRTLHRAVPHYVDLRRGQREVVLYRSSEDGTWLVANDFGEGVRFYWPGDDTDMPSPASLRSAEAFKRELDARGARLVLCVIPGPGVSLRRAEAMAAHLSVPLVVPDASEVRTIDDSHLSHESAVRVVDSLLARLAPYLR